jgi:dihydrofolate reductase
MARLRYTVTCSLDGYSVDADGSFDFAVPSEEVHAAVNDLEREVGTYLYGRRLYETMRAWQTLTGPEPVVADYGELWRAADKVVYSRTLEQVTTPRTRLERDFDAQAVRTMADAADRDVSIGGATLAAAALRAGIVDDLLLFVVPHLAGGGTRVLPLGVAGGLSLQEERRFANGTVLLRYTPVS